MRNQEAAPPLRVSLPGNQVDGLPGNAGLHAKPSKGRRRRREGKRKERKERERGKASKEREKQ